MSAAEPIQDIADQTRLLTALRSWDWMGSAYMLVFGLALAVRLAWIQWHPHPAVMNDATLYYGVARNLVRGRGYSLGADPFAGREPGYIFLLAATFKLFGIHRLPIFIVQAFIGAATCVIVSMAAARLAVRRPWVPGAVLAVWPPFFGYTDWVLTEVLATFAAASAMLGFVMLVQRSGRERPVFSAALVGLTTGLAALVRVQFLFWGVFAFAALWLSRLGWRRSLRQGVVAAAAAVMVFAPWVIRNTVVFNAFIPTRLGVGNILWSGSYVPWKGEWRGDIEPLSSIRGNGSYVDQDRRLVRATIANIKKDPLGVARIWLEKPFRIFSEPDGDFLNFPDALSPYVKMTIVRLMRACWLVLLGLTGFGLYKARSSGPGPRIAGALLALSVLSFLPINTDRRYQVPTLPMLLCLAASATARPSVERRVEQVLI